MSWFRLERQQKDFLKSVLNWHITLSFLFTLLRIESTNTIIYSRSSLENPTRFQTKKKINDKSLYPFLDQNGAKTTPFVAAHIYPYHMAYIAISRKVVG